MGVISPFLKENKMKIYKVTDFLNAYSGFFKEIILLDKMYFGFVFEVNSEEIVIKSCQDLQAKMCGIKKGDRVTIQYSSKVEWKNGTKYCVSVINHDRKVEKSMQVNVRGLGIKKVSL